MGVRVMNSQLHWIVYSFFFRLPLWLIIQKRRFRWKNTANDHEQIVLFKTKFNCSNNTSKPFQLISNVLRIFFQDGLSWQCDRISFGMKKAYFNIQSHFIQCRAEQCTALDCIASHCIALSLHLKNQVVWIETSAYFIRTKDVLLLIEISKELALNRELHQRIANSNCSQSFHSNKLSKSIIFLSRKPIELFTSCFSSFSSLNLHLFLFNHFVNDEDYGE